MLTPSACETSIPTRAIPGFREGSARSPQLDDHRRGVHVPNPTVDAAIGFARWEQSTMRCGRGSDAWACGPSRSTRSEPADVREAVAEIEGLGYPAVWVPEGGSSREIFAHLSLLLAATRDDHGVLGHRERHARASRSDGRRRADARGCVRRACGARNRDRTPDDGGQATAGVGGSDRADGSYLDAMDAARMGPEPEVPVRRLIAALGPRMLRVAASRALGAHTYFVPVEHTARARELLGPGAGARRGADRRRVGRSRGGSRDRPTLGGGLPGAPELREQLAPARLRG